MQDLKVIGVEDGALLVSSEEGDKYKISIDEVLHSKLRQNTPEPGVAHKLAPREIQAQIRAGMSAEDVASVTGVPLDYIRKFEGPVLAEREYVIQSALNVAVHTAMETDPTGEGQTFGSVILERLHTISAINERWASWKEQGGGWVVKLSFTAAQIDHDARWGFDPKKLTLAPLNNEANMLSQQGEPAGSLIPRLRAVGGEERVPDSSRFDSAAFSLGNQIDTAPHLEPVPYGRTSSPETMAAAINRRPEHEPEMHQTADLLEALRRRRGERELAGFDEPNPVDLLDSAGSTGIESRGSDSDSLAGLMRLVDIPLDDFSTEENPASPSAATGPQAKPKRGRAAIPSWDEIVFGARTDED